MTRECTNPLLHSQVRGLGLRRSSALTAGRNKKNKNNVCELPFEKWCANNVTCTFPFLPPGYLASSRRSAQERGDVDGPPRRGSGLSYNKHQPWGPEPGGGGHVTGDAAPETAVAQRGER